MSSSFNISNGTVDRHGKTISKSISLTTTQLSTYSISVLSPVTQLPSSPTTFVTSSTGLSAVKASVSSTSESGNTETSTTIKVGLGVSIGLVGLASIAGFFMWYLFLRQKRNIQKNPEPQYQDAQNDENCAQKNWWPPSELHAPPHRKLGPSELPS
jgi:hypothetical protein